MRSDSSDADGSQSTARADGRITRIGHLIRRTSIDELPQLLNVIRGEMSMVGPRPHALGSTAGNELFWHASQQYWLRHALKPGITGLAQIRGYRGATECVEDLARRSEEHTSELQSLMRISYAVFCLQKKTYITTLHNNKTIHWNKYNTCDH